MEGLGPSEVALWATSLGPKPSKTKKQNKNKKNKKKKQHKNKEGLGPNEVALRATSPDPKKNKNNKNEQEAKKRKQRTKKKKLQKYQKRAFQLSVSVFFFGWCPKFPFFDNLAQKARTQKTL